MNYEAYWSVFAPHMTNYVSFKRSLGYKYIEEARVLYTFDRFLLEQDYTSPWLTRELSAKWAVRFNNEAEQTHYKRVRTIRQFAVYLREIGIETCIPQLPKWPGKNYTPHIYSPDEINAIFQATDNLRVKCRNVYSNLFIMPCLLRLLYGTGIRIGEALNLKNKDVDMVEECLTLRATKNGKDRFVPLSHSLTEVCKDYLEQRNKLPVNGIQHENQPFFISLNGTACKRRSIYQFFRKVLELAGIPFNGKGSGPHIHGLRHTFACYSFVKLADDGMDLYCSWPYLATYLGHTSLAATEHYVRLTSQMYPELLRGVDGVLVDVLPDVFIPVKTNDQL